MYNFLVRFTSRFYCQQRRNRACNRSLLAENWRVNLMNFLALCDLTRRVITDERLQRTEATRSPNFYRVFE